MSTREEKPVSDLQKEYGLKSTRGLIDRFETWLGQYDRTIGQLTAQALMLDDIWDSKRPTGRLLKSSIYFVRGNPG